jgi:hypothetical protein
MLSQLPNKHQLLHYQRREDCARTWARQYKQPLLEFSGACAGCLEAVYAKLVTQLFGDRMMVANATGCSSVWAGSVPSIPEQADSLFDKTEADAKERLENYKRLASQ